jgi:hypothetical protein
MANCRIRGSRELRIVPKLELENDVPGPLHGYGIARRIEQICGDLLQLNQGQMRMHAACMQRARSLLTIQEALSFGSPAPQLSERRSAALKRRAAELNRAYLFVRVKVTQISNVRSRPSRLNSG